MAAAGLGMAGLGMAGHGSSRLASQAGLTRQSAWIIVHRALRATE